MPAVEAVEPWSCGVEQVVEPQRRARRLADGEQRAELAVLLWELIPDDGLPRHPESRHTPR